MKVTLAIAVLAALPAFAQQPTAAAAVRAKMQLEQAVAETQRLGENFDLLSESQGRLESRMSKLEGALGSIGDLKAEIAALRAENAALKARQETLRKEIVDDITRKIAAMNLGAAPAPRPAAGGPSARPASRPAPAAASAGPGYEHVVEPGQTLSEIARGYEVSVQAIRSANNLKGDMLRIGQKLFIPDPPKK